MPDDRKLLYRKDLAEMAGIKLRSLEDSKLPPRDDTVIEGGHARPVWYPSTAEAWLRSRPGKAWRAGKTTVRHDEEA